MTYCACGNQAKVQCVECRQELCRGCKSSNPWIGLRPRGRRPGRGTVVMCEKCDQAEAAASKRADLDHLRSLPSPREKIVHGLRLIDRVGFVHYPEQLIYQPTGHPSFPEMAVAGVPFRTDLPYREVLALMRTSTPRRTPPTQYVSLHVAVKPLFGSATGFTSFPIGVFRGWLLHAAESNSDSPRTRSFLLRADGALIASNLMAADRSLAVSPEPGKDDPSPRFRPQNATTKGGARRLVEQGRRSFAEFLRKPSHTDEAEVVSRYFAHDLFRSAFTKFTDHYV